MRSHSFTEDQKVIASFFRSQKFIQKNLELLAESLSTQRDTEKIHTAVVIYKAIGKDIDGSKSKAIVDNILKLQEGSSGFRLSSAFSASVLGSGQFFLKNAS